MRTRTRRRTMLAALSTVMLVAAAAAPAQAVYGGPTSSPAAVTAGANMYTVTPLVTDATGAPTVDPSLVNAWGMSQGPSTPVWVSNAGTGTSTLYRDATPPKVPLTVTIPGGDPTGQVFNPSAGFLVGTAPARFIFASEGGTLTGWNTGTAAVTMHTTPGAVYKGLAIGTSRGATYLYATNFHTGRVDVFNSNWQQVWPRTFVDKKIPRGFAPFGIQTFGSRVVVTYAKQQADKHDDLAGPGNGYVDVFSTRGTLLQRLLKRGHLNSPWGLAMAPAGWGAFGGSLLVGNFGDGRINAYNPRSGHFRGTLATTAGVPVTIDGLWGLLFGNGTSAPTNALMFTAGPGGEQHGLWGVITAG
jgi:uncharacterized protein (TIGR03118 family)